MYVGGFERNFRKLTTASTSFEGTDGQTHPYAPWPASADGLRVSYMEKHGKKFVAVRVADGTSDVVLKNEMVMVPGEHFGFGTRLSGEPRSWKTTARCSRCSRTSSRRTWTTAPSC